MKDIYVTESKFHFLINALQIEKSTSILDLF